MRRLFTIACLLPAGIGFCQGLLNDNASIVLTNGANVYIDGSSGHYTSQNGGQVNNNTAGGTITLLGNWINNSANVGFANDGATVVLAGASQNIEGSNSTDFYNLTLTGSGTKTLLVNTTAGGQSTFTGVLALNALPLDLNGFRLDVTNPAAGAITRSSGYIISETNAAVNPSIIRWYHRTTGGSKVYPFGIAGGTYIPFTFDITTAMGSATGYVDVSTRTSPSNNQPWAGTSNVAAVAHMYSPNVPYADGSIPAVIDRWWDITNSNPVTADVTFSYRGSENTLNALYSPGTIGAQYWDGTAWMPNNAVIGGAAVVTTGVGSVTAPGLSTFCPWVLSAFLSPLPVEVTDFSANCVDRSVVISWSTASEKDNDYFTLEKSSDGTLFHPIATVPGAGTSLTAHSYHYTDHQQSSEAAVYYRLKETDTHGGSKIFKVITVSPCGAKDNVVTVNNTQDGSVSVTFMLQANDEYTASLYDLTGRLVKTEQFGVTKEYANKVLDTKGLSEAYYMLVLQGSQVQKSQKVYIR